MVVRTATRCLFCLVLGAAVAGAQRAHAQLGELVSSLLNNERISMASTGYSSSSHTVSVRLPLNGPHALQVSAEYFRSSSLPRWSPRRLRPEPDWRFRSVPVTVSYTYSLPALTRRIRPVVGVGVSSHVYQERVRLASGLVPRPDGEFDYRMGLRMGAEATAGFRMLVSPQVYVLAQGRCRYVAHPMFGVVAPGYDAFTTIDVSLGLGFEL